MCVCVCVRERERERERERGGERESVCVCAGRMDCGRNVLFSFLLSSLASTRSKAALQCDTHSRNLLAFPLTC